MQAKSTIMVVVIVVTDEMEDIMYNTLLLNYFLAQV